MAAIGPTPTEKFIVVIDDHRDGREMLCRWLRRNGYQAEAAADGEEGLNLVRRREPCLVILDHNMPGKTGLETFAEMRGDPDLAHIGVVFYSADFDREAAKAAIAMGAKDWLVKGVHSLVHILEVISRHCGPGTGGM